MHTRVITTGILLLSLAPVALAQGSLPASPPTAMSALDEALQQRILAMESDEINLRTQAVQLQRQLGDEQAKVKALEDYKAKAEAEKTKPPVAPAAHAP